MRAGRAVFAKDADMPMSHFSLQCLRGEGCEKRPDIPYMGGESTRSISLHAGYLVTMTGLCFQRDNEAPSYLDEGDLRRRKPPKTSFDQWPGLSPYQRGVYTHWLPSARAKVVVSDEPTSTMVRMST